jgi:hypothetical protein
MDLETKASRKPRAVHHPGKPGGRKKRAAFAHEHERAAVGLPLQAAPPLVALRQQPSETGRSVVFSI